MEELIAGVTWHRAVWFMIAVTAGMAGSLIALRHRGTRSPAPTTDAPALRAAILECLGRGGVFAMTSLGVCFVCFEIFYPDFGQHFPLGALFQGMMAQVAAATAASVIAIRGARNIRNVALSGALLSGGSSCMLFLAMSALAAPEPLGYDLTAILAAMTGSGILGAIGFWQASGYWQGELQPSQKPWFIAASVMAASLVLVACGSMASILSFSDWTRQIEAPHGFVFQPIVVVSASEIMVTMLLALIGAAIDRRASSLMDRETERLCELSESTFEALVIHRAGIIVDANQVFCTFVGRKLPAIKGEPFATFLRQSPETTACSNAAPPTGECQLLTADGRHRSVEVLSRAITFAGGPTVVTAVRDITERQVAERKIRFLAHHDVLTGLPNRAQLHDLIASNIAQARQSGQMVAVLCLDLDRFKAVNDTYGHQAGDLLLQAVAGRLMANIRPNDAAARIGGDEFILLLAGITSPESIIELSRRLIETLSQPFDLGGFEARIGASIGIAIGPQDGTNAEVLMKNADIALYRAKANGRGGFCFFESGMDQMQQERRALEQDLRQAVAEEAFTVEFQPQFACETNEVVSFEALVRWNHPQRGQVSPTDFIPLTEATGLVVGLGRWVLLTACRAAMSWSVRCCVAVNVSARQFIGDDFAVTVEAVLAETGLDAERLELEITETVMIHEAERALASLLRLKALGVRLALDDFGTGFSSLSSLQRFPFDKVKIDKSFVSDLTTKNNARAIVGAILAMSHQLKLVVTAEGVETEAQLAYLRQQKCDLIQGYLLSRPIEMNQVPAFLASRLAGSPACL